MKLKQLETILQEVRGFDQPKLQYEQYSTGCHLASRMLFTIDSTFGDIKDCVVADVGCGCGILSIAAACLGSAYVCAFDIDHQALDIFKSNLVSLDMEELNCIDMVQADILDDQFMKKFEKTFDAVIMNPPFGTKQNKGIDMQFVWRALQLASKAVYSLHKTATRQHILKKARDWDVDVEVVAQLKFDVPNSYKFHKHSSVDIDVDLMRFALKSS